MRFEILRVQARPLLPLFVILALPACAGTPLIVATPSACSSLLPTEWLQGVPGAPLPDGNTVGDWVAFGDAQAAQIDKANDRYVSGVGIVSRCEARDAAAVKRAKPKFLGVF